VAEIGGLPGRRHAAQPDATFASRGCPVGCWFCIVPAMEGREFTLIPGLPGAADPLRQQPVGAAGRVSGPHHRALQAPGVKLKDANSGFEPITFTPDVYARWKPLINAGRRAVALRLRRDEGRPAGAPGHAMLADEPPKRKRVYVLIGNEPFAECMARIQEVIDHGCEPHVQPYMKLQRVRDAGARARVLVGLELRALRFSEGELIALTVGPRD
jgi:hypothetical protein